MTIEVDVYHDLEDVAADAGTALDRDHQASLHDRLDWFRLTHRHFPRLHPLVVRAREGGDKAWLFLSRDGLSARPLGSWYTLAYRPIFSGPLHAHTRLQLIVAIGARLKRHVAHLVLAPLDGAHAALLADGFRQTGWRSRQAETSANWSIDVAGQSFGNYWSDRPSRLRNTCARQRRRAPLQIRIEHEFSQPLSDAYRHVFDQSWKPDEGSMPFLEDLARQESQAGTLRLGFGFAGGQAVAAQLWLVENSIATIHKLAHDRSFDAISPGTQLSAAMFAHAIEEDGVDLIDFGTGDDAYKCEWTDRRQPLLTLELADPGQASGLLRIARWHAAALVRRTPLT